MSSQSYDETKPSKDVEKGLYPALADDPDMVEDPGSAMEAEKLTETKLEFKSTSEAEADAAKPPKTPPPKTLVGKIKKKKEESSNPLIFLFGCCCLLCGSIVGLACIGISLCIPISMVIIGSIYVHDCQRERFIPIYLIVAGCCVIAISLSKIIKQHCGRSRTENNEKITQEDIKRNPVETLLFLFCCAWFIAGSVWIYRIHHDFTSEDPLSAKYCHPVLYWFAFWMTTIQYILLAIALPFLCCCCCGYCLAYICESVAVES